LQGDDADAVEHRRRDTRRAERHRQETREQRCEGERNAKSERTSARHPRQRGKRRRHQRRQPKDRFLIGGQIERNAAHREDGKPKEKPPLLDLARERARERCAPVRRPRSGAGEAGGRGERASAGGSGHRRRD
jgi:hypothetical protein